MALDFPVTFPEALSSCYIKGKVEQNEINLLSFLMKQIKTLPNRRMMYKTTGDCSMILILRE